MSEQDRPEEKKIIIDEDWKGQVAAEKEQFAKSTDEKAKPDAPGADPDAQDQERPMPPASLMVLISTLATEAMMAMGQFPNPLSEEIEVNRDQARYAIDLLEVLQEKTKGNLDAMEEGTLRDVLHQLRMAFVQV